MKIAPGVAFSHYRLLRHLASGGMGSVWVAEDLSLERQVAVKFISGAALEIPGLRERFEREAKAAAGIASPHVVQILEHGVLPTGTRYPYIVMELLEGMSLRQRLKAEGTLSLRDTAEVVGQVAKALRAAHEHLRRIVHRDIKPENIFLVGGQDEIFVKVLDFGVAKREGGEGEVGLTGTSMVLGTVAYMSPEQLLTPKAVDLRTDLWALGVVSYEALTGRVPFRGETPTAVALAINNAVFELPSLLCPDMPPKVDAWFQRALARDPTKRFATAKQMAGALGQALGAAGEAEATDRGHPAVFAAPRDGPDPPPTTADVTRVPPKPGHIAPSPPSKGSGHEGEKGIAEPPVPTEIWAAPPRAVEAPTAQLRDATAPTTEPGTVAPVPTARVQTEPAASMAALHGTPTAHRPDPSRGSHAGSTTGGVSTEPPYPTPLARRSLAPLLWAGISFAVVATVGAAAWLALLPKAEKGDPMVASDGPAASVRTTTGGSAAGAVASFQEGRPAPEGMVAVPGGSYQVGCGDGAGRDCLEDARPRHTVELAPFAIMRHEVTVAEYGECVAAGACTPAGQKRGCVGNQAGKEQHPINCVTWEAARTYCAHRGWRLPSESEWEVAARGREAGPFPWGDAPPSCELTVLSEGDTSGCGAEQPWPVGSRSKDRSWVGAADLGGNVREWTATDYGAYPGGQTSAGRSGKVNRGGSYVMSPGQLNASYTRDVDEPDANRPDLGFRCAEDL